MAWEDFASSIAVWTFAREGFVVVRMGETEDGPVIWRERAFRGVELAVSLVRARREFALETAMFVIVEKEELRLFGCIWVLGRRWSESCTIGARRRGVACDLNCWKRLERTIGETSVSFMYSVELLQLRIPNYRAG